MEVLDASAFIHGYETADQTASIPAVQAELTGEHAFRFDAEQGAGMRVHVPDADAVITWSSGDYDPDTGIYRSFHSEGIFNDAGYDNGRVDELLEAQRETTDRDERREQLQEIEDRVIKDAPTAFFGHREDVVGHRSHVSGFVHVPFQRRLEYLWTSE